MAPSNRPAVGVMLCAVLSQTACRRTEPHDGQPAQPQAAAVSPAPLGAATANSATASAASAASAGALVTALADLPVNEWQRCQHGFTTSGDSKRDLMRLATVCGPVTGMQAMGPRFHGALTLEEAAQVRIDLDAGCVRLVASADGSIDDLEVEISTPKGESLGLVNLGRPWAVLPLDRPLCVSSEGTYRVRLSTHAGEGRYSLVVLHHWPGGKAP